MKRWQANNDQRYEQINETDDSTGSFEVEMRLMDKVT